MKLFSSILIMFIAILATFGQEPDLTELSKLEGGRRIIDYFKAFNSGDEQTLKDFFTNNLKDESLKQRPVEPRLEFHRQVRSDFQTLVIKEIMSIEIRDDVTIELLAQGKTGDWAQFNFRFEKNSPQKLIGWQIQRTEPPNSTSKQNLPVPKTKEELLKNIDKYINDAVAENRFSGVVLIAKDDKPIFTKAFGLANKENNTANNSETKFNLGSINKIFTRIAIGQLVKAGKISFDDKLGKYLPDYPNKEAAEKVTIRHLVTMTSGVADFFGEEFMAMSKDKLRKNADFIPLFSQKPLAFEPGTKNQYSNGGYILLGAIIEKVTGESYYDYVRENIFKVAGMVNTDSFEIDKLPSNTAIGYTSRNSLNELINNVEFLPTRGSAAGGGYSTVEDLLKFSVAIKSGKLIIPDDDGQPRKDRGLGIAGGSNGVNSILLINPESGYTIIVLANYDQPSAEKVGTQIRDWTSQIKE